MKLAWSLFAILSTMQSCADVNPDMLDRSAVSDAGEPLLAALVATRSTLVDGIESAENLLFTSDGRLLVTGSDAIYEVHRSGADHFEATVVLSGADGCIFTGIAEIAAVIYATCSDYASSTLFAARLTDVSDIRQVAVLSDVLLANGLASDSDGRLYIAEMIQGQIERLTFSSSDPFAIASRQLWLAGTGLFTDGLKVFRSAVYWTDFGSIKTATIRPRGEPGLIRTLTNELTFFDDLFVSDRRIFVADFLGGAIRSFDLSGFPRTTAVSGELVNPSAVAPAAGRLGLGADDWVVTEKGANRVALITVSR